MLPNTFKMCVSGFFYFISGKQPGPAHLKYIWWHFNSGILIEAFKVQDFITFYLRMFMYLLRMTLIGLKHVEDNN
jgi:hypothetical protein